MANNGQQWTTMRASLMPSLQGAGNSDCREPGLAQGCQGQVGGQGERQGGGEDKHKNIRIQTNTNILLWKQYLSEICIFMFQVEVQALLRELKEVLGEMKRGKTSNMQRSQMLWKGSILVQNVIKADWTYFCVKNSQANLVATPLNSENILAFEPEVSSILKYTFLNVCRY